MVQFDLPVAPDERRIYNRFRKGLLALGFTFHQKSVYVRREETDEQGESRAGAIRRALPRAEGPKAPEALALFGRVNRRILKRTCHFFKKMR